MYVKSSSLWLQWWLSLTNVRKIICTCSSQDLVFFENSIFATPTSVNFTSVNNMKNAFTDYLNLFFYSSNFDFFPPSHMKATANNLKNTLSHNHFISSQFQSVDFIYLHPTSQNFRYLWKLSSFVEEKKTKIVYYYVHITSVAWHMDYKSFWALSCWCRKIETTFSIAVNTTTVIYECLHRKVLKISTQVAAPHKPWRHGWGCATACQEDAEVLWRHRIHFWRISSGVLIRNVSIKQIIFKFLSLFLRELPICKSILLSWFIAEEAEQWCSKIWARHKRNIKLLENLLKNSSKS